MKDLLSSSISIILLFFVFHLSAQVNLEKFSHGFDFAEGVYLTYEEFKQNNPSIKEYELITEDVKYFKSKKPLVRIKKINYSTPGGMKETLKSKNVWGISKEGKVYILVDGYPQKLIKIGSIIYFVVATVEYSGGGSFSSNMGGGKQLMSYEGLLDFNTGGYYQYTMKNFLAFMHRDKELYNEFMRIKGKKNQKHKMISYIDKFNERNPIFFPSNNGQFGINLSKQ